tara:strand:- start:81 stop:1061 length:981 start_codon:yes stop_codon:yes gene_type:complete
MKAGRAFKFIFPEFSDSDVETLVDAFREKFSLRKYTLKTGKKPDEFTHAYQHDQAEMDNPDSTYDRKAMIHSCMRYRFDHLPVHPCSIYGSGDFEIVWLENDKGCIGGRCVVYTGGAKPAAGPIYGVCEKSLDMITEYLEGIGATINQDGTWLGAKLIKHEHNGGYVGPYLDLDPKRLEEDGDYLVVCDTGDIDASQYQGTLGGGYTTCSGCGDSLSEDEYYHSEYDEIIIVSVATVIITHTVSMRVRLYITQRCLRCGFQVGLGTAQRWYQTLLSPITSLSALMVSIGMRMMLVTVSVRRYTYPLRHSMMNTFGLIGMVRYTPMG